MIPQLKRFSLFASTQALSYFLIVANTRAYTQGHYGWTAGTDGVYAALQFFLLRRLVKDDATDPWSFAGYVIGGVIGSLLSIAVTTRLYGH